MDKLLRHNQAIVADESLAGGFDALLTIRREGDVGPACVSPIQRPLRLAMADDEDSRCRHFPKLNFVTIG